MKCEQARLTLWPASEIRFHSPETEAAQEHLESCASCQAFFEGQRALSARLERLAREDPPPGLRNRILEALRREVTTEAKRARNRGLLVGGVAIAATIALVFTVATQSFDRPSDEQVAGSTGPAVRSFASSDRLQVQRWLNDQVATLAAHLPEIPEARLTGGSILSVGGVTSGAATYELGSRKLTFYIVPGEGPYLRSQLTDMAGPGAEVVLWRHDGSYRAVVAQMGYLELQEIAKLCQAQESDHRRPTRL